MNNFLYSLKKVCEKYPIQKKILIVSDYSAGHELCESMALTGTGWVNLCPETATGLAHKIISEYLVEKNITVLNGQLIAAVVEEVFRELEEAKALKYFVREGNSSGLVRAIASSIFELRKSGVTSNNLLKTGFVNIKKGQDMLLLLKAYEDFLEQYNYIDNTGLILLASKLLSAFKPGISDVVYVLPSFIDLYPPELKLIKSIAAGQLLIVKADSVFGLGRSGVFQSIHDEKDTFKPETDVERLSWLYQIEKSPPVVGDGSLNYFQAYGLRNEVREIFRRLQSENIPLDTVTVAYTDSDYIPVFYTQAKRFGLGLTVNEGIPASFTGPGKVLQGFVEWIKSNFAEIILRDLIMSGNLLLHLNGKYDIYMSPESAARLLRCSGIGWGRERYVLLKDMASNLKRRAGIKLENSDEENRRERFLRQSKQAGQLYTIVNSILSFIPEIDGSGKINFRALTSSLSLLLSDFTRVEDENDAEALKGLISILIQAGKMTKFELDLDEALERVANILSDFRVGASCSSPGYLHLVSYRNLIWTNRSKTFIVGLDANSLPGSGSQDPVLLDAERKQINSGLPIAADSPKKNQYTMALALASRRGCVTLSFPSFDVVENRAVYPSSVLLQVYRLLKRDASLDYTALINSLDKPVGYCSQGERTNLDEVEWWLGKVLSNPEISSGSAVVRACYKGIDMGQQALDARSSHEPTEYDGIISVGSGEFDPRQNYNLVMSCSKIEELAGCPFAYFLRYILQISPPEVITYDPGRWLEPSDRGSLLHELFCSFLKRITEKSERPSLSEHKSMMTEMADELIQDYSNRIPPPSDVVYNNEVREIYRCCEVFLTAEETQVGGTPVLFEVPFGLGSKAVNESGTGIASPVEIVLGGGKSFLLKGKIDRVDKVQAGVYHLWDYKTGSTYGYDEHKYLSGGRQVQHALYAIAAEHILKDFIPEQASKVEISGYYFPTERGEGQRVSRTQLDRSVIYQALNHLFDLLAKGTFIAASHGENCKYCDYKEVCNSKSAVARAKALVDGDSSRLEPWRRLSLIE